MSYVVKDVLKKVFLRQIRAVKTVDVSEDNFNNFYIWTSAKKATHFELDEVTQIKEILVDSSIITIGI